MVGGFNSYRIAESNEGSLPVAVIHVFATPSGVPIALCPPPALAGDFIAS